MRKQKQERMKEKGKYFLVNLDIRKYIENLLNTQYSFVAR